MSDDLRADPDWEYGFRMDGSPTVFSAVFGLPFESLAMAQHAGDKSWTESIEYVRHPKGSESDDDWEAVPDER